MTDPFTTAVNSLATTIAQHDAAQQLGLRVDDRYQEAVADALTGLVEIAANLADTLGPEYARERLAREFVIEPDRTAGLLAAALIRLADVR